MMSARPPRPSLDIRDQASLEKIERYLSARRADQGFPARVDFRSYAGFKAIHRHLLQDLYAWAGRTLDDFATATARYVNEINAAHPFVDGNGRTQRFWLRMLADNSGFELRLTGRDRKRWNDASARGFTASDHAPMAALLKQRLRPLADPPQVPQPKQRSRKR